MESERRASFEETTLAAIEGVLTSAGLDVVEAHMLRGQSARHAPLPSQLAESLRGMLQQKFPDGLFAHQSDAIQSVLEGRDVCLATPTASGKSLVFMSAAAQIAMSDPAKVTLALYPARALIQDQLEKWNNFLDGTGIGHGFIDGSVPMEARTQILRDSRVVLMTPDVLHAWLMGRLEQPAIRSFVERLSLLVLDEAHVYEGAFGSNMAYLLRRLQAVAAPHQVVCSTATLGNAKDFMVRLTGRSMKVLDLEADASLVPPRRVVLASPPSKKDFDSLVELLVGLTCRARCGRFLAFADSRRQVEQLVMACHRDMSDSNDGGEDDPSEFSILPYRAGYESEDRVSIQKALTNGKLAGVVSTSALELGLDIGEIDIVVLLGVPPSLKSLWQRLGRTGRRRAGFCVLVDSRGLLPQLKLTLHELLTLDAEPNWLYLDNRYIQYANALCAAFESAATGREPVDSAFESLPRTFTEFLANELDPTQIVASDLYPLKQRAQAGPHREFPLRSCVEQEFHVTTPQGLRLGTLNFQQALREAYPGAIYNYMAKPYRVYRFSYRDGRISARREKRWTTQPIVQTKAFPQFPVGILQLRKSDCGFLSEVELQVSERVTGFTEKRGGAKPEQFMYGPGSTYYNRDLNRFLRTTGACWSISSSTVPALPDGALDYVLNAFCTKYAIQRRDIGVGTFFSKIGPDGSATSCQGPCVYDVTPGSLRLTERLVKDFPLLLGLAADSAHADGDAAIGDYLSSLRDVVEEMSVVGLDAFGEATTTEGDWAVVIADNQEAVYHSADGPQTVQVLGHRYTPHGLMYELEHPRTGKWMVRANSVEVLHGTTARIRVNLVTGETEALS